MADDRPNETGVSRRDIFELGSKALGSAGFVAAALTVVAQREAAAQQTQQVENHNAPNETDPGPRNLPLAKENPDSEWPSETDNGSVKPFKYSFALSRKRIESGGWTRQVTVRDLRNFESHRRRGDAAHCRWRP